jgi:hypothetical protein
LDDRSSPPSASVGTARHHWLAALVHWLRVRWRGEAPLDRVHTAVNAATTVIALFLISSDAPSAVVVAIYFAPMPLNAFLVFAVWRSAEEASATTAFAARAVSLVWLVAATAL